jgi:hypothetical protein
MAGTAMVIAAVASPPGDGVPDFGQEPFFSRDAIEQG